MESVKLATGETLTFDPAAHLYLCGGEPMPGTHALMERHGIVKPLNGFTAPYAERGTRIHLITQYDDEGDLDEESVDSTERGYLEGWRRFKREHGIERFLGIEELRGNAKYWYATKIDRIAKVDSGDTILINIKTGGKYKSHAVQLHLEGLLALEVGYLRAVHLDPTGEYHVEDYTNDDSAMKLARSMAQTNGMAHAFMATRRKKVSRKEATPI